MIDKVNIGDIYKGNVNNKLFKIVEIKTYSIEEDRVKNRRVLKLLCLNGTPQEDRFYNVDMDLFKNIYDVTLIKKGESINE